MEERESEREREKESDSRGNPERKKCFVEEHREEMRMLMSKRTKVSERDERDERGERREKSEILSGREEDGGERERKTANVNRE